MRASPAARPQLLQRLARRRAEVVGVQAPHEVDLSVYLPVELSVEVELSVDAAPGPVISRAFWGDFFAVHFQFLLRLAAFF